MGRAMLAVAIGAAAGLYALYGRGYPGSLALIVALAAGAVVWVGWGTWARVRELHRKR